MHFKTISTKLSRLLIVTLLYTQNVLACYEGPCKLESEPEAHQKIMFGQHLDVYYEQEVLALKEHHEALRDTLYARINALNIPDKGHAVLNKGEIYPNKIVASIRVIGRDTQGALRTIDLPIGRYDAEEKSVHPLLFTSHYTSQKEQRDALESHGLVVGNDDVRAPDYVQAARNFCVLMEGDVVPFQKHMKDNVGSSLEAYEHYEAMCQHFNKTNQVIRSIFESEVPNLMALYKKKVEAERDYLSVKENKELQGLQAKLEKVKRSLEKENKKNTDNVDKKADVLVDVGEVEEQIKSIKADIQKLGEALKTEEKKRHKKAIKAAWSEKKGDDHSRNGLYCYLIEKVAPLLDIEMVVDQRFQKNMEDWSRVLWDISRRFTVERHQQWLEEVIQNATKMIDLLKLKQEAFKGALEEASTPPKVKPKRFNKEKLETSIKKYTKIKENLEHKLENLMKAQGAAKERLGDKTMDDVLFADVEGVLMQLNRIHNHVSGILPGKLSPKTMKQESNEVELRSFSHSPSTYLKHNIIFMGHSEQALMHHLLYDMEDETFGYTTRLQALLEKEDIKHISGLILNVHTQRNLCKCCATTFGRFLGASTHSLDQVMRRAVFSKLKLPEIEIAKSLFIKGHVSFTDHYDPRDPTSKDIRNLMTMHTFEDEPLDRDAKEGVEPREDVLLVQVKLDRPLM